MANEPVRWDGVERRRAPRTITPESSEVQPSVGPGFPISEEEVRDLVSRALEEDGAFNDVTTAATIHSLRHARGRLVARESGVVAGVPLAVEAFRQLDPKVTLRIDAEDGSLVGPGTIVMFLSGHARGLLSAERVALNFLQRLSGVASYTRRFVEAVRGTDAQIYDTRKTTPGWRKLERYAVRAGGGMNHRFDLASAVLIKDNHLSAVDGDVRAAVQRARMLAGPGTPVEVECERREQVEAALEAGADIILLDNMEPALMAECVRLAKGRAITEASGGVTLHTARRVAETGVDRISVGALTHSPPALDLALDFD